jgi:hypothetical protein
MPLIFSRHTHTPHHRPSEVEKLQELLQDPRPLEEKQAVVLKVGGSALTWQWGWWMKHGALQRVCWAVDISRTATTRLLLLQGAGQVQVSRHVGRACGRGRHVGSSDVEVDGAGMEQG